MECKELSELKMTIACPVLFVGQTSSGKWYCKGTKKYLSNSGLEDIVEVGMVPEEGPVHRHHHLPAISIEPILGIFEL